MEQPKFNREVFLEKAANSKTYKVIKKLYGELSYAYIGDRYGSEVLYDRGYNINRLVKEGFLECVDEPFEWQEKLVGRNVHSVKVWCPECLSFGINQPLDIKCGNCGYPKGITYYDAQTINDTMKLK